MRGIIQKLIHRSKTEKEKFISLKMKRTEEGKRIAS